MACDREEWLLSACWAIVRLVSPWTTNWRKKPGADRASATKKQQQQKQLFTYGCLIKADRKATECFRYFICVWWKEWAFCLVFWNFHHAKKRKKTIWKYWLFFSSYALVCQDIAPACLVQSVFRVGDRQGNRQNNRQGNWSSRQCSEHVECSECPGRGSWVVVSENHVFNLPRKGSLGLPLRCTLVVG